MGSAGRFRTGRGGSLGRAGGGGGAGAVREGGTDISPPDVRESDIGARCLGLNEGWVPGGAATWAVAATVQPVHELAAIVPHSEDQDHPIAKCFTHGGQAAEAGS